MRREIVAIMVLLLCAACESRAQIVFWNVENFFDTRDERDREDDDFTPDGEYHWNRKRYLAKRNFIAKGLIATADSLGQMPPSKRRRTTCKNNDYRAAIISISTKACFGNSFTAKAARAGNPPLKYLPYTAFMSPK